jgi:lipopolysaccharide exporter
VMHSYRPRLSLGALADLFHFSKWMLLVNCLSFLKERSSDFVVGRLAGPHALGIFSVSAELANMPGTELIAPINRAVFPAYARLAHDPEALRTEYLSVMGMVGLLAIPAVAGMAATAPLIVPVILGPNWLDAQVILTVLAFFGITQVVQSNAFSAYMALGRPDILARLTASHVIVLLTLLISLTVWKGVIGAAFAYLITALIMVPLTFAFLFPRLQLTTRRFARVVWRPMLASAVMFAVVREFIDELAGAGAGTPILALVLIAAIIVGMVTYVAAIAVLWVASGRPDGAERVSGQRVQHFLRTALAFARARLLSVGQGRGE